ELPPPDLADREVRQVAGMRPRGVAETVLAPMRVEMVAGGLEAGPDTLADLVDVHALETLEDAAHGQLDRESGARLPERRLTHRLPDRVAQVGDRSRGVGGPALEEPAAHEAEGDEPDRDESPQRGARARRSASAIFSPAQARSAGAPSVAATRPTTPGSE